MANIVIEGGDEMVRAIRNRFNHDKVARVVKRNTAQAQQTAMRIVPVAKKNGGTLKRSITMRVDVTGLAGYITAGAYYGPYVEYGTRYMDSQPFMRPAAREQAPIFINDLRNLLRKG